MNITDEFPVSSATSDTDKETLLRIRDLMPDGYGYVETGSHRGGSLVPFLRDPRCARVLSIDPREQVVADSRGVNFDFSGYPLQKMLEELAAHEVDTTKLENFDGGIEHYRDTGHRYDFLFIDGEHTDLACFRDFVHGVNYLRGNAVIAFHDATLVYKALQIIQEYLLAERAVFRFVKIAGTEMAVVLLGDYAALPLTGFPLEIDLARFYRDSETMVLSQQMQHRLEADGTVGEKPTVRGY